LTKAGKAQALEATAEMTAPPKHRWFRFGLRTVFVLLTIACTAAGWSAYQLNWIRQRHDYKRQLKYDPIRHIYAFGSSDKQIRAPRMLWLFGEEGTEGFFIFGETVNPNEADELKSLFPEARISQISPESQQSINGP
jgi:hypothetical protein